MSIALTMAGMAVAAMQAASGAEITAEPEMIFPEGMAAVTERLNAENPVISQDGSAMIFPEGMAAVTARLNAQDPSMAEYVIGNPTNFVALDHDTMININAEPGGIHLNSREGYSMIMPTQDGTNEMVSCGDMMRMYRNATPKQQERLGVLMDGLNQHNVITNPGSVRFGCAAPTLNDGPQ